MAVEEVMQAFDILINIYEDRLLPMSADILSILLSAFKDYKKDEDNDNYLKQMLEYGEKYSFEN